MTELSVCVLERRPDLDRKIEGLSNAVNLPCLDRKIKGLPSSVNPPCLDRKIKGLPSCVNSSLSSSQDQGSVDFEKHLSRALGMEHSGL